MKAKKVARPRSKAQAPRSASRLPKRAAIVGLGYVGLPLLLAVSRRMQAVGFDVDRRRLEQLTKNKANIPGIRVADLRAAKQRGVTYTADASRLADCQAIVICVPTPVGPTGKPDLGAVRDASRTVSANMGPETLVILESTTYPGTTREVVLPLLEAGGRKCGRDFFLAYSPERVDPGNATFTVENTDKLVGGIDEASGRRALDFYRAVIGAPVHLVASAEVAESAKMLENVFRNVNIALINELSLVFDRLGVNTWDVVKAATSKPYGFMPFYPGPGVGGHCIPVDPLYLSYRAHQVGVPARFIELGHQVNSQMPIHAVGLAERAFWQLRGTYLQGAPVGVLGLAYKRDIPDTRESPSIQIVRELVERGAQVTIHDPFAATPHEIEGKARRVKGWREVLEAVDVAIFVVDHTEYRAIPAATLRAYLRDHFIIDCRNLFPQSNPRILGIGRGRPTAKESRGLPT